MYSVGYAYVYNVEVRMRVLMRRGVRWRYPRHADMSPMEESFLRI